jgi:hypothetical protein
MRSRWILLCCALALTEASSISAQVEHHVCRLLKPDELKALIGSTIVLANVLEEAPSARFANTRMTTHPCSC